jgi:hypothetical protein
MTRIDARLLAALTNDPAAKRSDGERSLETQLRRLNVPPFVVEHRFDSGRKWRLDFAWPELLVAIEVEGGTWTEGRHTRGGGFEADCVKYSEAAIQGWLVIRVTTGMVDDGRAVTLVGRALWARSRR